MSKHSDSIDGINSPGYDLPAGQVRMCSCPKKECTYMRNGLCYIHPYYSNCDMFNVVDEKFADVLFDYVTCYNDKIQKLRNQNAELKKQIDELKKSKMPVQNQNQNAELIKLKKQNEELKKQIENLKNQKNPAKQRVAICKSNGVDCGNKFLSDGVCKNYDMCSCKKILFLTDAEFANFIAQIKANVRE